ncbi:radical SAM protein, partial [Acidobacteriota bacterium]
MHPELSENNQRLYRSGDSGRWLEDGNIELRGRKDYLVKVRGFRVELGEIKSKLLTIEQVRECVVVDRETATGQKYLIAYVVADSIGIDELKRLIRSDLPQYMIPKFVILDSLPLMPNGKVDRERLPNPESGDNLKSLNPEGISALLESGKEIEALLSGEEDLSGDTPLQDIVACYSYLYRQIFSPESLKLTHIEADIFPYDEFLTILTKDSEEGNEIETNIVQFFEQQILNTPDNIALTKVVALSFSEKNGLPEAGHVEFKRITYRELKKQSDHLAQIIIEKGAGPGSIIAILSDPAEDMIPSILAVLKAGATYLLIPLGTPRKRVITLLDENNVVLLLSDSRILEKYPYTALQELSSGQLQLQRTPERLPINDLDSLPLPDRSLVDYEKYSRYIGITMVKDCVTILSSRGCPYNCAYCHKIWPNKQVCRSAENIFREVQFYYDMGVRRFAFIDDIFNLNIANNSLFFEMVLEHGLDAQFFFSGDLRGDILTPGFIDLMVKAGTAGIAVALETASPRLQKLIGKNLNVEKLRKNLEYISRTYPQVILEMHTMHGFPSESEEEARLTLEFIKNLKWLDFPYIHMVRIYPNTEMERIALAHGVSKEAVLNSEGLAYHEWSPTSPFEKSFTRNYQAEFLNNYFLSRERLLHVLPRQMKVLTEADMVQKYHSYLPVEIKSLNDILDFVGIKREELGTSHCQDDKAMQVDALNLKLERQFPAVSPAKDALRIMFLDLSQYFSASGMLFDVVESPHGLISLLTYLNRHLGGKIHGKIAKARADFDNYFQLKMRIEEFKPDVIGIRTLTFYKDFFHRTVAAIRHWGIDVPIIADGPYASSDYNTIL